MNQEKEIPKTYYEKILVSSGEVPEVTGYYHFFRKNDKNKVEFLKFIAKSQSDKEWFRKHMSAWLKPVPSPKQEAVEFAEWMEKEGWIILDIITEEKYSYSQLYDKKEEKCAK